MMKRHWLAVLTDQDLTVARVAVGNNKEMKIKQLSEYKFRETEGAKKGQISDEEFAALKNWLQRQRIPLKKLKLALSSYGLITRVIALPQMSGEDLEKIVANHIDQYFTLNVENYIIDYRILRRYRDNGKLMMDVLLAAFPKDRMANVWSLCQYLGFEPTIIDLTADCLARLYSSLESNGQPVRAKTGSEPVPSPGDLAIVSLQADKIEFVLLENGLFFLYSDQEFACQEILEKYEKAKPTEPIKPGEQEANLKIMSAASRPQEEKGQEEEEELKLYLSSYLEDEVELLSAQEAENNEIYSGDTAQEEVYAAGQAIISEEETAPRILESEDNPVSKLDEDFLNLTIEEALRREQYRGAYWQEPDSFAERDRFLNELIGLEAESAEFADAPAARDKESLGSSEQDLLASLESQELLDLLDTADSETDQWQEINQLMAISSEGGKGSQHYLEDKQAELERTEADPKDKIISFKEDPAENDLFHLDDGIFLELTRTLPQLDFSLPSEEETGAKSQDVPGKEPEMSSDEELPAEGEGLRYAALNIQQSGNDDSEFVLEDLFVPLENLTEELVISETRQNMTEPGENVLSSKIFDTLDLSETRVGWEEAETREADNDPQKELETCLEPVLATLAELLSFFAARHFGSGVSTIYLTGEYCTWPDLAEVFQENLGVQTLVGFPGGWKPQFETNSNVSASEWQKYGSLYGLALRED